MVTGRQMKSITTNNRKIGPGHPSFIIDEMSGNHNQSLDRALAIVEAAAFENTEDDIGKALNILISRE